MQKSSLHFTCQRESPSKWKYWRRHNEGIRVNETWLLYSSCPILYHKSVASKVIRLVIDEKYTCGTILKGSWMFTYFIFMLWELRPNNLGWSLTWFITCSRDKSSRLHHVISKYKVQLIITFVKYLIGGLKGLIKNHKCRLHKYWSQIVGDQILKLRITRNIHFL